MLIKRIRRPPIIKKKEFNMREFYEKRNSILILRSIGGLGDILVHRMIFEDFKKVMPDAEVCFACPKRYHEAVYDHPCIDQLLDSESTNPIDYFISYNTSNACCRYELAKAPFSGENRSDIWANHCGVNITNHDMHINLEDEFRNESKNLIENHRNSDGPTVLFTPISAMGFKNLIPKQIKFTVQELRNRGLYVYSTHTQPIPELASLNVPVLMGSIRTWMGFVYNADYVVTVDTSVLHMAGGIKKPMVGIFGATDSKVYCKYYPNSILVQKHRDNGDWDCGPCYNWPCCVKSKTQPKPCILEITDEMIAEGINEMLQRFPPL